MRIAPTLLTNSVLAGQKQLLALGSRDVNELAENASSQELISMSKLVCCHAIVQTLENIYVSMLSNRELSLNLVQKYAQNLFLISHNKPCAADIRLFSVIQTLSRRFQARAVIANRFLLSAQINYSSDFDCSAELAELVRYFRSCNQIYYYIDLLVRGLYVAAQFHTLSAFAVLDALQFLAENNIDLDDSAYVLIERHYDEKLPTLSEDDESPRLYFAHSLMLISGAVALPVELLLATLQMLDSRHLADVAAKILTNQMTTFDATEVIAGIFQDEDDYGYIEALERVIVVARSQEALQFKEVFIQAFLQNPSIWPLSRQTRREIAAQCESDGRGEAACCVYDGARFLE